jgi:hypothetical protein
MSAGVSAMAQLTVTTANQHGTAGTYPFTPSWTIPTGSLIAGQTPLTANGNFTLDLTSRSVNSLTAGGSLAIGTVAGDTGPDPVGNTTTSANYVTCGSGSGAGNTLIYSLPTTTYGYNLTNITVFSGWADNGRDGQYYTVWYSTVANPTNFVYLTAVSYNPSVASSTPTANRAVIADASGGVIAASVAAVKFDFTFPGSENGWVGYGAITVQGNPAASLTASPVIISTATQTGTSPYTPTWTLETPNLIAGVTPSTANGTFNKESSGGVTVLNNGVLGISGDITGFATCGSSGGNTLVYPVTGGAYGSDVTNIVVYSGWGDGGRDGQYYVVSYSTIAAPTTYVPICTVLYNPTGTSGAVANRVAIRTSNGTALGSGVANIKFDFATPVNASGFDNAYQGFSEIIVQGKDASSPPPPPSPLLAQDTLPTYVETVAGDQVILTAAFSSQVPANLQWQFVGGGVTNDLAGATSATLTLNNVEVADSGSYRLKAVNATNSAAAPSYSTTVPVVVSALPAAVNNVILAYAGQCGAGPTIADTNFVPTWALDTANDLILGFPTDNSGNPGTATAGNGNYGLSQANGDPTILADGSVGYVSYWPGVGASPTLVTCGSSGSAPGASMTYYLNTSSAQYGYDITNITVYGGWGDGGRNEQKYQVLYSTVAAPATFINLGTFDYNPSNPNNYQSATRTMLVPASGALAQGVYAVQINWALAGSPPKNGYEGYSEVIIKGTASANKPTPTQDITPLTASDTVGGTLKIEAAFSGATSYQWKKDGTNIPGATTSTLILNNLQAGDTATNGGYSLVASNSSGVTASRGCAVTVLAPAAAVGNVIAKYATQSSDAGSFSPTWDTSSFSTSLIAGMTPTTYGSGNFNDPDSNPLSGGKAGGLAVLTDSDYGTIVGDGSHPAFATCGPNAGQFVTYTLPASTYGYDVTNIQISSGWNDGGRDAVWGTVYYSTVASPEVFIPIGSVSNNPTVDVASVIRATLAPASGALVRNAAAILVDFTVPSGIPNGYSGFSQINVFGTPSAASYPTVSVTGSSENLSAPDWVIETPSLIAGQLPSSVGTGAFAGGFNNEAVIAGLPALTDGAFQGGTNFATCGGAFGSGRSITYTCANGSWDITNIVVYSGWGNYDRDGQFYNIYYTTLTNPSTQVLLQSVYYNPPALTGPSADRVAISPANGSLYLATNVASITFDFSPQTSSLDNGYSGYAEIVLMGTNVPGATPVLPTLHPTTYSAGKLIVTGTGGTSNGHYTWLETTNLAAPAVWTTNSSGALDSAGAFSNALPVNAAEPKRFFRLRMP